MNPFEPNELTGMVFDLKRFAVHDGTGLRSTLFLKGCPLRCPWCQNPEGLEKKRQLWYRPAECLHCGTCAAGCPRGVLSLAGEGASLRIHADLSRCILCGTCQEICPSGAIEICGREITAEEAAGSLMRDRVFFGARGGVTLSGGEVLSQWRFALAVLGECKNQGADTAVETSLYGSREALEALTEVTDHFLIDIKILDPVRHREVIGTDNRIILENYEYLLEKGADVLVRTPLIPGYTAEDDNIRSIARYIRSKDPDCRYELLNYNPLCRSKYEALEKEYPVHGSHPLTADEMEHFYSILEEEKIPHIIKE